MRRTAALLVLLVAPATWCNADESAGTWIPAPSIVQTGTLNAVTSGGGGWVAVGRGGAVVASTDGVAWEAVYPGIDDDLNDVVWFGGSFVAVGDGGVVLHSHDGRSWSVQRLDLPPLTPPDPRSDPEPITLERVIATPDGLVAVGQFRGVVTSDDGETWTVHPSPAHGTTLAWSGTTYLVAGGEVDVEPSPLYESTDLETWSEHDDAISLQIRELAWNGNGFLAAGSADGACAVWSATDPSAWEMVSSQCVAGLTWAGSRFLGVDEDDVLSSPGGETWTREETGVWPPSDIHRPWELRYLRSVEGHADTRVAVGAGGVIVSDSPDRPWQLDAGWPWSSLRESVWTGRRFVAVGMQLSLGYPLDFAASIVTSDDGLYWTGRHVEDPMGVLSDVDPPEVGGTTLQTPGQSFDDVAVCGGRVVATDLEGSNFVSVSDDDGLSWRLERLPEGLDLVRIEGVSGRCVAIGTLQDAAVIARSDDGATWSSEMRIPNASLKDVAWTAGRWVVAGSPGGPTRAFVVTSPDGEAWRFTTLQEPARMLRLAASDATMVALDAGGRLWRSSDGLAWEQPPTPPPGLWGAPFAVGGRVYVSTDALYSSSDGSTWRLEPQSPSTQRLVAGAASPDRSVAIGAGTIRVKVAEPTHESSSLAGIAHQPGVGSLWRSDLTITNTADDPAIVQLLTDGRGDPWLQRPEHPLTVPPRRTVRVRDALWALHGAAGAATLRFDARGGAVTSWARTFNQTHDGTYGQLIPSVADAEGIGTDGEIRLLQLAESADPTTGFRSNIGVVNLVDEAIEVEITLLTADGSVLAQPTVSLGALRSVQLDRPLAGLRGDDIIGASAVVRTSTPGGRFTAYASVIDNRSGDPIFIRPAVAAGAEHTLWLPGAAHGVGRNGSLWRTDLEVHNPGPRTARCTVELLPWGPPEGGPWRVEIEVEAGATRRFEDVVATLFGWTSGGATLTVTPTVGTVMAGGRTFTTGESGSFGQYLPAVLDSDAADPSQRLWLTGLEESDAFRSNLGLANVSSIPTTVQIRVLDDDGASLGQDEITLAPLQSLQIDRVLTVFDTDRGAVILRPLTPGTKVLAYGSMVDNRTNDPVLVPAVRGPVAEDPPL